MIFPISIQEEYFSVFVNGDMFNCLYNMSLKDFILYLNYDMDIIIIEYNRQIIPKYSWSNILLKPDDCIEIITIVGGG